METNALRNKKLGIPTQDGIKLVKLEQIIHCQGFNGYTKLFFTNERYIVSSNNIGYFCNLLKEKGFYLVHKSHLINLEHLDKYLNTGYLLLTGNHKIPVSRSKRSDFLKMLKR